MVYGGFVTCKSASCTVLHFIQFREKRFRYLYNVPIRFRYLCLLPECMFSPPIRLNSLNGYLDE